MLSPTNQAIRFYAHYTESKVGKTGLTVTVDVYRGTTQIVTDGAATEIGGGLYTYQLAAGSTGSAEGYTAVFKTATTSVDQQHIPALWVVGEGQSAGLSAAAGATGGLAKHDGGGVGSGDVAVTAATLDDAGDTMYARTSGGVGIDDVAIRAYVASEWAADPSTATLRAETRSLSTGAWRDTLMLDDGVTYSIVFSKSGYTFETATITP